MGETERNRRMSEERRLGMKDGGGGQEGRKQ